jgi:hypothetical protein
MNTTPQNSKPRAGAPAPSRADASHSTPTTAPGIPHDAWGYLSSILNQSTGGDPLEILRGLPTESVDLVITRPPLRLSSQWPALFKEVVRVMKRRAFCVSYGLATPCTPICPAWCAAGLIEEATVCWQALSKPVCIAVRSKGKQLKRRRFPQLPETPDELPHDRIERMRAFITPLVERYSKPGQIVLDPFADEAVSVSIHGLNRPFILIEDEEESSQELDAMLAESQTPVSL